MIAITGMHRSGTSFVARFLHKCGFSFGTSHPLMDRPRDDNPAGHHENMQVVAINEAILKLAGGTWWRPPAQEKMSAAANAVGNHIREFFDSFNGNIFKDPRLCLTLAEWAKHCPDLVAVVHCIRHPMAVAQSLQQRNGTPIKEGISIWQTYNERFLAQAGNTRVLVVDYNRLENHAQSDLASLAVELTSTRSTDDLSVLFNPKLDHSVTRLHEEVILSGKTESLYRELQEMALNAGN